MNRRISRQVQGQRTRTTGLQRRLGNIQRFNQVPEWASNNKRDALIAETAIRNDLTLVTEDRDLAEVARDHGGAPISR